jgi:hypothetical protein
VGDVDGDGIPDILSEQSGLNYYPGKGNGAFGPDEIAGYYELVVDKEASAPTVKVYKPAGDFSARCGMLGDFDGDNDLDWAVLTIDIDENLDKLYVFQNNGSGYFTKVSSQVLGPSNPNKQWQIWIEDLNNDDKSDLVLTSNDGSRSEIYVMYGRGKMAFSAPKEVITGEGEVFFCGDINHDSHPDLALKTDSGVNVFWGTNGGAFVPGFGFSVSKDEKIYGVTAGDLNADGLVDFALALGKDGLLTALQTSAGFTQTASYKIGTVWEVKCGDFTGDGISDILAWINGKGYVVMPSDGFGRLDQPRGGYLTPSSARLVWVGDLNGDGRSDLILNYFGDTILIPMMNGGTPHGETYLPLGGSQLLGVGDIDDDGDQDLLAAGDAGLDLYRNDGIGILERERFVQGTFDPLAGAIGKERAYVLTSTGGLIEFSKDGHQLGSYALGAGLMPKVLVGDFDGDEKQDVIVLAKRSIFVLWGGDNNVRSYQWRKGDLSVAASGDFDDDGVDELALISTAKYADMYVVSFSGRRIKIQGKPLQLAAVPLAMAAGDIDGDGIPDPVTITIVPKVSKEGDKVNVTITGALLGMILSRGGMQTYKITDFPEGESPWPFSGLAVGDVTGDGKADVIYSLASGGGGYILPGNGDGTFGKAQYAANNLGPLFIGDIDGNGQLDLVGSTLGFNPRIVIRWNGGER